jgi:hypothetical protein
MKTQRFYRVLASALLSLLLASASGLLVLLAFKSVLSAQTTSNPVVAYAYVGENTTPGKISAFAVHLNGTISRVSGSPFRGPAHNLVGTSGYVFGTDGLNIATYRRLAGGGLLMSSSVNGVAHNDTPNGSAVGSMTLDRTGSSLYASEINFQGADNDAYAEFSVASGGILVFGSNTSIDVNDLSSLQFSQDDKFAFGQGCYFATWAIPAFDRDASGQLTPFDPGNTFPPDSATATPCPDAVAASSKGYLAIAWGNVGPLARHSIEVLRITPSGALQHVSNLRTNFTGIVGIRFDPTGKYLAVAGTTGIETFRLNTNGTLTLLSTPILRSTRLFGVQWDSVGHVYAISSGALYVFRTHNGVLALVGQPVAVTKPQSLAVLTPRSNAAVANATLSATSLTLPAEPLGTTSPAVSVQLSNNGTATLSIAGIAASGDFGETNTCGSTLAAGAQCSISVTFTPSATGTRFGTVLVTDNAPDSPQTISLAGFGLQGQVATLTGACSGAVVVNFRPLGCGVGPSDVCPVGQPAINPTVGGCGGGLVDAARSCVSHTFTGLPIFGHCVAH